MARRLVLLTEKLARKKQPNTYLHSGTDDTDLKTVWHDVANSTDEYFVVAEYFYEAFTDMLLEAVRSQPHVEVIFAELKDPVRYACVLCVCVCVCVRVFLLLNFRPVVMI